MIRLVLTSVMLCSLAIRSMAVPGSRNRYRASTVFRATVIPVTVIVTIKVAVSAASGDWSAMFWDVLILLSMPLYFRWASDEDDWWTGRWTKIRKAVKAAFATPAASASAAGA